MLEKVLSAAFKSPTNDHLRQFEFIVVRGQENIARLISPVAENTKTIQQTQLKAAENVMDKDGYAMFVDALPKQQRMLIQSNCLILPFFRQKDYPLCKPADQSSLNYFASAWAAVENILLAATAEGLACAFRIPIGNEPEYVKHLVNAPAEYEFTFVPLSGKPRLRHPPLYAGLSGGIRPVFGAKGGDRGEIRP